MTDEPDPYPEHTKLKKLKTKSDICGAFIDWLRDEKGYVFAIRHKHTEICYSTIDSRMRVCETMEGNLEHPAYEGPEKLLAQFFEIDLEKLEQEKRALLEVQRALNKKSDSADS